MSYTLVIGGNGFIGKHVCDLLSSNKKVISVGRSVFPQSKSNQYWEYVSINEVKLQDLIKEDIEIIDLAYSTSPGVNSADLVTDLFTNVKFSLDVFEESLKKGVKKLVIVSSGGTVYGNHGHVSIKEFFQQKPISPYGVIKSTIEQFAFMYYNVYKLPVNIVRPSNAYGLDQKTTTGQGFIAAVKESIKENKQIQVYGDAGNIRDYIHVKDVASGIVSVLEHGVLGESYNISTGIGTSNIEVINYFKQYIDFANNISFMPKRLFDVDINILDNTKLKSLNNWSPSVTLEQGIKDIWYN